MKCRPQPGPPSPALSFIQAEPSGPPPLPGISFPGDFLKNPFLPSQLCDCVMGEGSEKVEHEASPSLGKENQ